MDPILETSPNGTITGAIYYLYEPSKPAAWIFTILFATASVAHAILIFVYRSPYFIPLVIGTVMETFAYYGRVMSSEHPQKFGPWIMQAILVMSAPPLIAAPVYVTLARLIYHLKARSCAMLAPRAGACLFIFGDVVAFCSQLAGTGLQAAQSASAQSTGRTVVLAGLIFQLVLLVLFFTNVLVFHLRLRRNPTMLSDHPQVPRWRYRIYTLYVGSICIFVRNVVRMVEYVQGNKGTVARSEPFVYIFDGALMLLTVVVLAAWHPGRLIQKAKRVKPAVEMATVSLLSSRPQNAEEISSGN